MKITCSRCGGFIELDRLYKQRYCRKCQVAYAMDRKARRTETPLEKARQRVRIYTNKQQSLGLLKKQPCANCGATPAEKHHNDYNKPLEVTWLCRSCHRTLHNKPYYQAIQPIVQQSKTILL